MDNYIDEKIIPIKVSNTDESQQSLEEGYYISGRLETFSKEKYFEGLISAYVPDSFINMPDEVKEIKYPTNFRPDIIKTNLLGDIDLSFSLLTNVEKIDVEVMAIDFMNLTPRPRDIDDGLSYELSVTPDIADKYTMTTMEAVNATGVLEAVIDRPNHVSVRPVNPLEMMEWINSRPTAKENPYYLTKILASISIRDNGGSCNVSSDW